MAKRILYWLKNDLRVIDNTILADLSDFDGQLDLVFVIEPRWFKQCNYQQRPYGDNKYRFLLETLFSFAKEVAKYGQTLHILQGNAVSVLTERLQALQIDELVCTEQVGYYELQQLLQIQQVCPQLIVSCFQQDTLFQSPQLPFSLSHLPKHFTEFRKQIEKVGTVVAAPRSNITQLPSPIAQSHEQQGVKLPANSVNKPLFTGGLAAAQRHCQQYFSSSAPSLYKQTRNELAGFSNSTKFSPWLAVGALSAKQIYNEVTNYEHQHGANESSYWIKFELLWREYFKWYAYNHHKQLFNFRGLAASAPLTTFNGQRFAAWCQGKTPYALVNAIMNELNTTGYISNRARQISASCLVNELALDWRYGAAYFEQQLIDYDVAINWGNWQYIAGVGADPRGGRHFNINKQTSLYDPKQHYIDKWQGNEGVIPLDSIDAVGWPI